MIQKQHSLLLAALLSAGSLSAQCGCCVFPTIEDLRNMGKIISLHNDSIWQIGTVRKNIPSYNGSNEGVLITDTLHHYTTNLQSEIYFLDMYDDSYAMNGNSAEFSGLYFVESDSLNDFGTMHVSFDNKQTWLNLLDTAYAPYVGGNNTPIFTGRSATWKPFTFDLGAMSRAVGTTLQTGDTVFIKLTFTSDSNSDTLAGWAIRDIVYCHTGINEIQDNSLIFIYPNPTHSTIYINRQEVASEESIAVFNAMGIKVWEQNAFVGNEIPLQKLGLPAGIYTLRYHNNRRFAVQRFVYLD